MGFVQKLWKPLRSGGTPFSSSEFNRLEQAIADLYAIKGAARRLNLSGTTWDLTGLDGDAHKGYDITAFGLYAAPSPECATYLTKLTPAQSYTHSEGMYTGQSNAGAASA